MPSELISHCRSVLERRCREYKLWLPREGGGCVPILKKKSKLLLAPVLKTQCIYPVPEEDVFSMDDGTNGILICEIAAGRVTDMERRVRVRRRRSTKS